MQRVETTTQTFAELVAAHAAAHEAHDAACTAYGLIERRVFAHEIDKTDAAYIAAEDAEGEACHASAAAWCNVIEAPARNAVEAIAKLDVYLSIEPINLMAPDEPVRGTPMNMDEALKRVLRDLRDNLIGTPYLVSLSPARAGRFYDWAAERDRLWSEAAGLSDITHKAEIDRLWEAGGVFEQKIRNAPCNSPQAAEAKLLWVHKGFADGMTGDEVRVLDQVLAYVRGALPPVPGEAFDAAETAYEAARAEFERLWDELKGCDDQAANDACAAANSARRDAFLAMLATPAGSAANRARKLELVRREADTLDGYEALDLVEALIDGAGEDPGGPDAELLTLGEELERRWAAERELDRREASISDAELDAVVGASDEIVRQIDELQPQTVAGWRIRARALAWRDGAYAKPLTDIPHLEAVLLLLNDLMGYPRHPRNDDDQLIAIGERFKIVTREEFLLDGYTVYPIPASIQTWIDVMKRELGDLRERACRLRATTPEAVRIKAILALDYQPTSDTEDYDETAHRLERSLVADVLDLPSTEMTSREMDAWWVANGYRDCEEDADREYAALLDRLGIAALVAEERKQIEANPALLAAE